MIQNKGAHFYRCDFQVHTPRDTNWQGQRATADEERKEFSEKFVRACREKKLHAVAITDHHDFAMFPHIRAAAQAEVGVDGKPIVPEDRLVVFPGLELTLGVPCQALLILDADLPTDRLQLVLEALAIEATDTAVDSLPPVVRLDRIQTFGELYEALDTRSWLRGRYIVLPNVTDKGHGTLMRAGMQAKYKKMPCVGGYLDGTVETKVGQGNRRIFDGLDANWGNHRLALFQTSDCRSESFHELGRHSTWVKWAIPTAEALRQACLAEESRISQKAPQLPSVFISRLVVTNSKFLGPVDLGLNAQYTALIGGRGTGKSTILDYLRWCLCDQPASVDTEDVANPLARQKRLIEATLKPFDGHVEVHFTINEIPHLVRRHAQTGETFLKVGDADLSKVREGDIRSLLPVHAYSQKQLSSVSVRVEELNRFVTAPIKARLDELDRSIDEISGRLRENYATLQRHRNLDTSVARSVLSEKSLADQAANLRASLTGLSEADLELLNNRPTVDCARDAVGAWQRELEQALVAADRVVEQTSGSVSDLSPLMDGPKSIEQGVEAVRTETRQVLQALSAAIEAATAAARRATNDASELSTYRSVVRSAMANYEIAYEEVKARSTAHEAKLSELAEVDTRRKAAASLLQQQQRELKELGDPYAAQIRLRNELVAQYQERSNCLEAQCQQVTALSGGLLRAEMRRGHGLDSVESKLRSLTAGSGLRGTRIDELFQNLRKETDPIETWESVLVELETLLLIGGEGQLTSQQTPNLTRLGLPVADQRRIQPKMSPDAWLDLALTPIADQPVFEYQTKEKEFISFELASAGQQATALLRVLLSQRGMPLIIDQPEEDLDSQVIQDIVRRLWDAKRGRQVIFSSHNANLVVNGDAELVVVCDYRTAGDQSGGKIKVEGAIDIPAVREEITRVMEGGEKAFRLRKDKYGF